MGQVERTADQITAVILAGGRSSRMGCDKTLAHLGATPIVLHQLQLVAPFVSSALIATNLPNKFDHLIKQAPVPTQIITDGDHLYQGPLAGILAAAHRSSTDWLLVRAADMPWLVPDLMCALIAQAQDGVDAVVPRGADNYPEPLCALYRRAHVCALQEAFNAGKRRVSTLFHNHNTVFIEQAQIRTVDPELTSFQNINYPDQLAHVQRIFACSASQAPQEKDLKGLA